MHECVVKASLNPFCSLVAVASGVKKENGGGGVVVGRIASPAFDRKVRGLARTYFRV